MAAASLVVYPAPGFWLVPVFQFERLRHRLTLYSPHVPLFVYFARHAVPFRRVGWHSNVTCRVPMGSGRAVLSFRPGLCAFKSPLGCAGGIGYGTFCDARHFLSHEFRVGTSLCSRRPFDMVSGCEPECRLYLVDVASKSKISSWTRRFRCPGDCSLY